jgi:hypothetical protein
MVFWEILKTTKTGLAWPLLGLGTWGSWRLGRSRENGLVLGFPILSVVIMVLLVPWVTAPSRQVCQLGLALAIPAGFAIVTLARRLPDGRGWLLGGGLLWAATFGIWTFNWGETGFNQDHLLDPQVSALHLTRDDVILTEFPLQVASCLDVPTVMCPCDEVLHVFRYHPHYILITPASGDLIRFREKKFPGVKVRFLFATKGAEWYEVLYGNSSPE